MAVKKIFWQDPYLTNLSAQVTTVDGQDVTLDQTIFFAFSGGQHSDSGFIGGQPVLACRKDGREIVYTLPPDHGFLPGQQVETHIDWARRYRLMRLHFAAELVLELVYQNFNRPEKLGADISEEKARLDFLWPGNISVTFPVVEERLKQLIGADRPITSAFENEEAQKRYWAIEGFAQVACGGTHLKRTGEVGPLILKRKNPGGGKERIEIFLAA